MWLYCQKEQGDFSNYLCCFELVLSVHPSLKRIEVCNLFPSCVIQCAAALCSPEEHKQLPAPLIHTGALNSFYAQHPTPVLRREIICMYLPAARLISLADLLCIHAASSHIVLPPSDDMRWLTALLILPRRKFQLENTEFFTFVKSSRMYLYSVWKYWIQPLKYHSVYFTWRQYPYWQGSCFVQQILLSMFQQPAVYVICL